MSNWVLLLLVCRLDIHSSGFCGPYNPFLLPVFVAVITTLGPHNILGCCHQPLCMISGFLLRALELNRYGETTPCYE